jgi:hypothetical protein
MPSRTSSSRARGAQHVFSESIQACCGRERIFEGRRDNANFRRGSTSSRQTPPDQVIRRLVLGRRTNLIAACADIDIDESLYKSDDHFVDLLLLKLGFDAKRDSDSNLEFWRLHTTMFQILQTASASATVDESAIRSIASNYFVALEGALGDALGFFYLGLN